MVTVNPRSTWRPSARHGTPSILTSAEGVMVHYTGGYVDPSGPHSECLTAYRGIQRGHLNHPTEGYIDVAYNSAVCRHGIATELRGLGVQGAANGDGERNRAYRSLLVLVGNRGITEPTPDQLAAGRAVVGLWREDYRTGPKILGHKDGGWPTDCPGGVYRFLRQLDPGGSGKPNRPTGGEGHKPPGEPLEFPLRPGEYWGPPGPGAVPYNALRGTRTARYWLQAWTRQLGKRGWPIGVGRRYLTRYGADGLYGAEYASLVVAFQRDQGLDDDRLLGRVTWDAAYLNPVT